MAKIQNELYGEIEQPDTVKKLFDQVLEIKLNEGDLYYWRGQANIDWVVNPTAFRRLEVNPVKFYHEGQENYIKREVTEKMVLSYETRLLKQAKRRGFDYQQGKRLSDFEILARLQHHGASTRLLDVSRNTLVALFFSCNEKQYPSKDCLLLGVNYQHLSGDEENTECRELVTVHKEMIESPLIRLYVPPNITPRIAAQHGAFIFSKIHIGLKWTNMDFLANSDAVTCLSIKSSLKKEILTTLKRTFDIHWQSLFPDFDGFASSHNVTIPVDEMNRDSNQ